MAGRNVLVVISEIIAAMNGVEAAMKGKTVEDFSKDWLLKHGVERGLEIISEAVRHLPREYLDMTPDVPWKDIRGLGNVFRHEYQNVSDAVIWAVVARHLPRLRTAIEKIKDEAMRRA